MKYEEAVPSKLVKIRSMSLEDVDLIGRWFEYGSCKTASEINGFHETFSVLHYQERMQKHNWVYQCKVVEDLGHPAGYFDYRYRTHHGEICGIYAEPQLRMERIDQHLLRWIIADLREHGCSDVRVEIQADKFDLLGVFQNIGFQRDETQHHIDSGKSFHLLRYLIKPFQRLSPQEPAYRLLQTENLYLDHVALAEALIDVIKNLQGVEVILGLGSLARGFGDQWSDLDLAVFGRGPDLYFLGRGEFNLSSVFLDLFVINLDASSLSDWGDSAKQAYEESVILFAKDTTIIDFFQQAFAFRKGEQVQKIQEILLKLGWIGFQPRQWYDTDKYGYFWTVPYDLWIRRGSITSAHTTIDLALEYTLHLLFLANGRRAPDIKWLRFLAPHLPWLPPSFNFFIEQVDVGKCDEPGFRSRAMSLLSIVEGIIQNIEEKGLINGDIYQSYIDNGDYY